MGMAITADLPPKPLVPLEIFSNGNCLDKTQDTEFLKKIKFIREFKQFEENRIKNTLLNSKKITINASVMSKENTNTQLIEKVKAIPDLKTEFSKDIETLNRTQAKIKVKLKNSISH